MDCSARFRIWCTTRLCDRGTTITIDYRRGFKRFGSSLSKTHKNLAPVTSCMQRITRRQALTDALEEHEQLLIFKHSTRCSLSASAHEHATRFSTQHPDAPVVCVHVIEDRAVSNFVEETTGVTHASPQAILVREQEVVWSASHQAITLDALIDAWNSAKN